MRRPLLATDTGGTAPPEEQESAFRGWFYGLTPDGHALQQLSFRASSRGPPPLTESRIYLMVYSVTPGITQKKVVLRQGAAHSARLLTGSEVLRLQGTIPCSS